MFKSPRSVAIVFVVLIGTFIGGGNLTLIADDEDNANGTAAIESAVQKSSSADDADLGQHLLRSSVLYGVFSEIVNGKVLRPNVDCVRDVSTIMDGILRRDVWALKSRRICVFFFVFLQHF